MRWLELRSSISIDKLAVQAVWGSWRGQERGERALGACDVIAVRIEEITGSRGRLCSRLLLWLLMLLLLRLLLCMGIRGIKELGV